MGIRQYQRVRFTGERPYLKAAVFVYRANHGQWNTVWGAHDNGPRSARILDLRTLMAPEDQRQFGRVYISSFLDATLRGRKEYLPLFRDHRVAADWLPKTMYITRFEESTFRPIAGFEEDIDVTSGSVDGVGIVGDSLATWQESRLSLRTANSPAEGSSQYNNAVTLGWNNRLAGEDTTRMGPPAAYTLTLPEDLPPEWSLDERSALQFLMMPTETMPGPRAEPRDSAAADSAKASDDRPRRRPERKAEDEELPPVDFSIELTDAAGASVALPISSYGVVRRPLESWILMRRDIERERFARRSEIVLQTYSLPLADFTAAEPALDVRRLRSVRFLFDRAVAGTIIVDDIGFAALDPAYLAVARDAAPSR
jgi:hypothetical protein